MGRDRGAAFCPCSALTSRFVPDPLNSLHPPCTNPATFTSPENKLWSSPRNKCDGPFLSPGHSLSPTCSIWPSVWTSECSLPKSEPKPVHAKLHLQFLSSYLRAVILLAFPSGYLCLLISSSRNLRPNRYIYQEIQVQRPAPASG